MPGSAGRWCWTTRSSSSGLIDGLGIRVLSGLLTPQRMRSAVLDWIDGHLLMDPTPVASVDTSPDDTSPDEPSSPGPAEPNDTNPPEHPRPV